MTAKISGQKRSWETTADLPDVDLDNPEIERLWALAMTEQLMEQMREAGETDKLRQQISDLGTNYSLVTDYTSMLVVTDAVMEGRGIQRRNADRVQRERAAQQQRTSQPAKSYRVDKTASQPEGSFGGNSSPGIGSGPVGLLALPFIAWLNRRKKTDHIHINIRFSVGGASFPPTSFGGKNEHLLPAQLNSICPVAFVAVD